MRAIAFLAALALPAVAPALTLDEAIETAFRNDPQLRALAAEREAVRLEERAANRILADNPELGLQGGGAWAGADNGFEYQVSIEQPLRLGGQGAARSAAVAAALERQAAAIRARRIALRAEVRAAWVRALAAREREALARDSAALATEAAEAAEQRLAEGRIRRIDRNAAVVEAARAGREAASAAIESAKAAAEVRRLLGLAADEPLELEGTLAPRAVFPAPVPVPDPVRPRQAPAVLEARLSLREAQARRALADAAAAPDLTVGAYFLRELDTDHLFATVAIPLPLFDRNESERAAARREEAQAEAALVETERSIAAAREEARVRLGAAGAAVAAWEAAALEAVNENLALATEAFREGDIGFPAYLLLRREALAGRLAWIDALEELALAQAEWERLAATGGE